MFVRGKVDSDDGNPKTGYDIESLRGFDFFPQTGHVEGVLAWTYTSTTEID